MAEARVKKEDKEKATLLFLVGPKGTGKTTLLKHIAANASQIMRRPQWHQPYFCPSEMFFLDAKAKASTQFRIVTSLC